VETAQRVTASSGTRCPNRAKLEGIPGRHANLRLMRKFALTALTLWCVPAFPWSLEGHRLVARLAEGMLTTAARARLAAILHADESLASVAGWADDVRPFRKQTEPWHFVDIPITRSHLEMQRDCPQGNCIIGKINDFRTLLQEKSTSSEQRHEALLFLVHFAGDLHQPLHCSTNDDRGGNDTAVRFRGQAMNLHRLWDRALLERMPAEDELYLKLRRSITPEQIAEWSQGTAADWAEESFQVSRQVTYGNLPKVAPAKTMEIPDAYEKMAEPIIERQLEKAGVRLASLLNDIGNSIE
jgi:nuclease S1